MLHLNPADLCRYYASIVALLHTKYFVVTTAAAVLLIRTWYCAYMTTKKLLLHQCVPDTRYTGIQYLSAYVCSVFFPLFYSYRGRLLLPCILSRSPTVRKEGTVGSRTQSERRELLAQGPRRHLVCALRCGYSPATGGRHDVFPEGCLY